MQSHDGIPDTTGEETLDALLLSWEEGWEQGRDIPPAVLCSHKPHLQPELARRIEALKAFSHFDPLRHQPVPAGPDRATAVSRFNQLKLLGAGGLGVVYEAFDSECRRTVALKFIRADYADDDESQRQFVAEAQVTGQLEHPGIVPVYGLGRDAEGRPCFAMRLIRGISLADAVAEFHQVDVSQMESAGKFERWSALFAAMRGGNVPRCDPDLRERLFRELLNRFSSVCQTVAYAHSRGVLHRDLKPANIMLGEYGETLILDWGLAKEIGSDGGSAEHRVHSEDDVKTCENAASAGIKGTPAYMSPEQVRGVSSEASDVYGLGATLYALLTGCPPFEGPLSALFDAKQNGRFPAPRARNQRVPRPLEAVCLKAMALRPEDRYASPLEIAGDLENWLADRRVTAYAEPWSSLAGRWMRRHSAWVRAAAAALVATSVLAGVALIIVILARRREAESRAVAEQRRDRLESRQALDLMERREYSLSMLGFAETLQSPFVDRTAGEARRRRIACLLRQTPRLVQLWQLDGAAVAGRFSPDGDRIVVASASGTAQVLNVVDGRLVGSLMRHNKSLTGASFSPDGRLLVTSSRDGTARVWNALTGEPQTPPLAHDAAVTHAAFRADGLAVVTSSADGTARIWRSDSGEPLLPPLVHQGMVNWAAFSPDGKQVVTAVESVSDPRAHGAVVWDVHATPAVMKATRPHSGAVHHVHFSPDGSRILSSGSGAAVWDAATGRLVCSPQESLGFVWFSQFNHDGSRFVTADGANKARIWDARTGRLLCVPLQMEDWARYAEFGPDDRHLSAAGDDGTVRICLADSGTLVTGPIRHAGRVNMATFSPDGRLLLTLSTDRVARIWDLAGIEDPVMRWQFDEWATSAALGQDGHCAATAAPGPVGLHEKVAARLWIADGDRYRAAALPHDRQVRYLGFSPDGRVLASATEAGSLQFWNAEDGGRIGSTVSLGGSVIDAEFSWNGQRLLILAGQSGNPSLLQVWDRENGSPVMGSQPAEREIAAATISPDGTRVAFSLAGPPAATVLRSIHSGTDRTLFDAEPVSALQFSPDGRLLAAVAGSIARLYTVEGGRPLTHRIEHGRPIRCIVFSADSTLLATGSDDNTASLWNLSTGQRIGPPMRHDGSVTRAVFSPDGRLLATMSSPASEARRIAMLIIWDAQTGEPLASPQLLDDMLDFRFRASEPVLDLLTNHHLREWNLAPLENWTDDELLLLAQLYCGRRTSQSFETAALSPDELRERWDNLRGRHPPEFTVAHELIAEWHAAAAAAAAQYRRPTAVISHLSQVATRRAERSWELMLRGVALHQLQHFDQAIDVLTRAIRAGAEQEEALMWRARSYRDSGDVPSALRDLNDVMEDAPHIAALRERALLLADSGQYESAAADLRGALQLNPYLDVYAWYQACALSLATGNHDSYRELVVQMLDRFRNSQDADELQVTAWSCLLAGGSTAALPEIETLLQQAALLDPQSIRILRCRALAKYRSGDASGAIALLELALGRIERGEGMPPGDSAGRQYALSVDRPCCLLVLAMALKQAGRTDEAEEACRKGIELAETLPRHWGPNLALRVLRAEAERMLRGAGHSGDR